LSPSHKKVKGRHTKSKYYGVLETVGNLAFRGQINLMVREGYAFELTVVAISNWRKILKQLGVEPL